MANLTASIPHQLGRDEARRRIQEQIVLMRRQPGFSLAAVQETWSGDRMDFVAEVTGHSISGYLIVDDSAVHVNVSLPWILGLLAGSVKHRIEHDVRRLLAGPGQSNS